MSRELTVEEFLSLAGSSTGERRIRKNKPHSFRIAALIALLFGVPVVAASIGYVVPSAEATYVALACAGAASLLFLRFRDRFDFLSLSDGYASVTDVLVNGSRIVSMRIAYALDARRDRLAEEAANRTAHLPLTELFDLVLRRLPSIAANQSVLVTLLRLIAGLRRQYLDEPAAFDENRYRRALALILYKQAGKRGLALLRRLSESRYLR